MSEPLKIAVAGLGTVGAGILKLLSEHGDLLEGRCGRKIQVTAVSARDQGKDRGDQTFDHILNRLLRGIHSLKYPPLCCPNCRNN